MPVMLNAKQNFLETIKKDGKPDRLVKQYEATVYLMADPFVEKTRGNRQPGMEPSKDAWGTTIIWPEGNVAAMPHITDETKVIKDITRWREELIIPDFSGFYDPALWTEYLQRTAQIDRDNTLLMGLSTNGVFERLHHLMGFEDLFVNLLTEPEAVKELCEVITERLCQGMKVVCDMLKPDAILSMDDWGAKNNLFISPELWREFIKPCYVKFYGYLKERGVLIIHHADSFLEPLVEDMAELGIDVWQGVLPQNDIPKLQKLLDGRMAMMGGLDSAIIDRPGATEEEIRADARRACENYAVNGHFITCVTYGGPRTLNPEGYDFINDEIDKFNRERFLKI
jgi:hypothetical protein